MHGGAECGAPFRRDLPDADVGAGGLLDCPELDDVREIYFELAWHQHGGSGLTVSVAELDDMRAEELLWYLRRVRSQREKESAALKKGGGARVPRPRASRSR